MTVTRTYRFHEIFEEEVQAINQRRRRFDRAEVRLEAETGTSSKSESEGGSGTAAPGALPAGPAGKNRRAQGAPLIGPAGKWSLLGPAAWGGGGGAATFF